MRTSGGKAAPSSRWAEVLFRVCAVAIPLVAVPLGAAMAATTTSVLEPRTLLTLGIILGVIAFAVWTAIACLRARERARKAESEAELEAERYRLSQNTLETLLAAEPQALLTLAETGEADLLVATLPPALGVPRDVPGLLDFANWLDSDSAQALHEAIDTLAARGEAFNLMLHTQPDRFVEADGWAAGRTVLIKIRDLAGQRLDLADLAAKHQELEEQVSSLRGLLEDAQRSEPVRVEVKPSLEARFRSFDRLATAFAVFDGAQRLTHFNQAYVDLWQLDPEWLAGHPRDGEILDRLRQARRLPEKADYRDWKKSWLAAYGTNLQMED
jgi:PAS domain-containing protein